MTTTAALVASLEKAAGYKFTDQELAERALTHTSFANHFGLGRPASNERLECLGDALLKAYVARHLYLTYPDEPEGILSSKLARAVSGETLAKVASTMGLNLIMRLSPAEEATGGRQKARNAAGCYEAVTGAVFLDGGQEALDAFLDKTFRPVAQEELSTHLKDAKSKLQELLQSEGHEPPSYKLTAKGGLEHKPTFYMSVISEGESIGTGNGPNTRAAEQDAAKDALRRLNRIKDEK